MQALGSGRSSVSAVIVTVALAVFVIVSVYRTDVPTATCALETVFVSSTGTPLSTVTCADT